MSVLPDHLMPSKGCAIAADGKPAMFIPLQAARSFASFTVFPSSS